MAWVKVPPEHHAPFVAALPADPRVEVQKMFGGLAAKVNGNVFAGLFGVSVMLNLDEADKAEALALPGAGPFDPMGDGRVMSRKVMLPRAVMGDPDALSGWIARAFATALARPASASKKAKGASSTARAPERSAKPVRAVSKVATSTKRSASTKTSGASPKVPAVAKKRGAR